MNRYLIKLLITIPCVFLFGKEISVHPEPGKGIYEKPFSLWMNIRKMLRFPILSGDFH